MFRKIGFGAAAALTVGILAAGCSDDGDTIILGGGNLTPGAFPGSQAQDNNVAEDARAFSPPGEAISGDIEVFWNFTTRQAVVVYVTSGGAGNNNLIAHYFDGSRMHPGVQIRGLRGGAVENSTGSVDGIKGIWINTSGNATANVASHNGKFVLTFTRNDEAPAVPNGTTVHETANRRLFGTIFDPALANAQASGTIVRGWDTAATVLDNDNIINGAADPDVETFGFVSDSLVGSHTFTTGRDEVVSGQSTSHLYIFFGKNQRSGTGTDAINRFRFLAVDMTQATLALPTTGGTELALGTGGGAYTTGQGAQIGGNVVVHDNAMFWNSPAVNTENDAVVTVTVFAKTTPGSVQTAFTLGEPVQAGQTADNTTMPTAGNVYGPDHGLLEFVAFYEATGYTNTALADGNRNPDRDMMVTKFADVASPTPERLEIDAHTNTVLLTGTDQRNGTRGAVVANSIQTRIDRSGNYIGVIWLQDGTDQNTAGGNTTQQTNTLWARAVQVRKNVAGATTQSARTLANSVSTAGPLNAPSLGTGNVTTGAAAQSHVRGVQFQQDLADGQSLRGCTFQGNHLRMNFVYQQLNDQNGTVSVPNQRRLSVNGMRVTLGATDTDRPSQTLVSASEVVIETVDQTYFGTAPQEIPDVIAVDAGDNSRTNATPSQPTDTAGRVIVFFRSQDNVKLDNQTASNGRFQERRFYAWENGNVVTISANPSSTTSDLFQATGGLGAVTVPTNLNADSEPNHVGRTLHVYFTEQAIRSGAVDIGTRSYNLTLTQPAAGTASPALGERFFPATTTLEPVYINLQRGGSVSDFTTVKSGETVGAFFIQDNRLRYQQTSTNANGYYKDLGTPNPELVDNESDNGVNSHQIKSPPACDDLSKTMAFYRKQVTTTSTTLRAILRILN
ncbi:MAG: hypothetical protein KF878_32205 [Planctomycetes bacterium]|nr:hypothetical protein [Planctomycetota bacterium]